MHYGLTFSHQVLFISQNSDKYSSLAFVEDDLKFIWPACDFAMCVKVKADIYFFCFIVAPNEAMCRLAVIIKGKIYDEHRIIIVVMNEEVVNARSPVFYIPEREFYRWSGTCAIRKAGCLCISHQGGISGIDECIESVQFEEGFLSSYQINLAHANR